MADRQTSDSLSSVISALINDPQMLNGMMERLSQVTGKQMEQQNNAVTADEEANGLDVSGIPQQDLINVGVNEDRRIALLRSIRPFLDDRKQQKVDGLVRALGAASIISRYRNDELIKNLLLR